MPGRRTRPGWPRRGDATLRDRRTDVDLEREFCWRLRKYRFCRSHRTADRRSHRDELSLEAAPHGMTIGNRSRFERRRDAVSLDSSLLRLRGWRPGSSVARVCVGRTTGIGRGFIGLDTREHTRSSDGQGAGAAARAARRRTSPSSPSATRGRFRKAENSEYQPA